MKVLTSAVNNPIFIELQFHLLKRYMPVPYDFIVFNDAKEFPDSTNQGDTRAPIYIESICNHLGIKCIRIPNSHHQRKIEPSQRTSDSMNIMLQYQRTQPPDEYIILDSDMFPIAPIPLEKYRAHNCAVVLQERQSVDYIWNGLLYFDMRKLTNTAEMNWDCMPGFDTGGMMFKWLKMQDPATIYYIKHISSLRWGQTSVPEFLQEDTSEYNKIRDFVNTDPRNEQPDNKYFCEIYDNAYLHYRAGSNWRNEGLQFHQLLTNKLRVALLPPL